MKFIFSALAAIVLVGNLQAEELEVTGPGDLMKTRQPTYTVRFINYYLSDFRMLFCSESVLSDRMKRSVSLIFGEEVNVLPNDTVRSVMERTGSKFFELYQYRLIKANMVLQSSIRGDDNEGFLGSPVSSGDFLIRVEVVDWDRGKSGLRTIKREAWEK